MNILVAGRLLICLLLVFGQTVSSFSQTPLSSELQPDPAVRIGKLENGLTYYIRQNKKPEQKVELRLKHQVIHLCALFLYPSHKIKWTLTN